MDSLTLQDIHTVGLAEGRRRYRRATAAILGALAELPEIAHSIRHSAAALSAEAQAVNEKFIAAQDAHIFAAAYDWHLAAAESTRRTAPPLNPQPSTLNQPQNAHV